MDTGAYLGKKGWIQGHILGEITDLEFGTHGFLMNHVFLPTEQVETNICCIIYQDATFKICLSLFGWKENILPKVHIVQCGNSINLHDNLILQTGSKDMMKWNHKINIFGHCNGC